MRINGEIDELTGDSVRMGVYGLFCSCTDRLMAGAFDSEQSATYYRELRCSIPAATRYVIKVIPTDIIESHHTLEVYAINCKGVLSYVARTVKEFMEG